MEIKDKFNEEKTIVIENYKNDKNEEKIRKYIIGRLLRKGKHFHTYEFTNQENCHISLCEIFPKTTKETKLFVENELSTHKNLKHPNITKFEHNFEDSDNYYILTEICSNGNLYELLEKRKTLTELEIKYYFIQLVNVLKYLKDKKIVHRNLKLENIFISDKMIVKVGGFHLATQLKSNKEKLTIKIGTPNYIAPELLNHNYSYEVDVWALGVILYTLIFGKKPFYKKKEEELYKIIINGEYSFPENCQISEDLKDLIKKILVIDVNERIKLDQILNHNFLKYKNNIPTSLPISTLKNPPDLEFIQQYENKNSIKIKKENDLENQIEQLKSQLLKEQKLNEQLSKKNKELEQKLLNQNKDKDNIINLMNKIIEKDEEIKQLKSVMPFEIRKGEKLISVIFSLLIKIYYIQLFVKIQINSLQ